MTFHTFHVALGFAFHLAMEIDLLFCFGSLICFLNKKGPVQKSELRSLHQPSVCLLIFKQAIPPMVILQEGTLGICCNEHFHLCQVKASGKARGSPAERTGPPPPVCSTSAQLS